MRIPAVAGQFYHADARALAKDVDSMLASASALKAKGLCALVCPHAGHMYSGGIAAHSFASLKAAHPSPPSLVLVGPNHTGIGSPVALSMQDWQTPLGVVRNDSELGKAVAKAGRMIDIDEEAHRFEHSLEVQLPFLQRIYPTGLSVVPICIGAQGLESARDVALAVDRAASQLGRTVVLIASSDFTHYEPAEEAKRKDSRAIDRIVALDAAGFVELVERERLSICGYGPIAAAIEFARLRECRQGKLLYYGNSGERSGDYNSVVAYASIIFAQG
ncbi:MAG: MEMO1 family protein [Candidatus Micrarchaeia archaeon]